MPCISSGIGFVLLKDQKSCLMEKRLNRRDGCHKSLWQGVQIDETYSATEDIVYDVLIIGAGITGTTAAVLLQEAGKKCLLVDAYQPGYGTTGGTSAHINTFADTTYKEAESSAGEKGAKLFAEAIKDGLGIIENNIQRYKIDCDFERKAGYLYAEDDKQAKQLYDIYEGAVKVGVQVNFSTNLPSPVPYKEALVFENQAQFHPLKYLQQLLAAFIQAGGEVMSNTVIENVKTEGDIHFAAAGGKTIRAKHIFHATHIPLGLTIFNLRCAPYRSYVLGVTLKNKAYPDALIYDMQEPYHYFRSHKVNNEKFLVAGGNDHKTGHDDPAKAFKELERFVRNYYDVDEVKYRWSSQYYVPVDGLPYIGRMPGSETIYCATGYNGNGMMLGSIAAKIVSDLIIGKNNIYKDVFDPARIKPVAGFKEFMKENADAAYQFVAGRFGAEGVKRLKEIAADSGQIVEFEGKRLAIYKDKEGKIHALNPVCTHAGCIVSWNAEEKTWDCPCHGARYDIEGRVLNGPASKHLQKVIYDDKTGTIHPQG